MSTLTPNYIVGLTDGEGSFTVYIQSLGKRKDIKRRVRAEPRFYLKLREEDKDILYELREFFGCGNVYLQKDKRRNHKDCYRYEVTKREDLEKIIIPFFREHELKLSSKRRDFEIFCKVFQKIKKGKHLTKWGLRELHQLKQKMH